MHKFLFYNRFIIRLYVFRAPCAHRQEIKIVLYSIWYHHTCRWHTYKCDDTRCCIIQFQPSDDEHVVLETYRSIKLSYYKTRIFAVSWLITKVILRCTVSKTSKVSAVNDIWTGYIPAARQMRNLYSDLVAMICARTQMPHLFLCFHDAGKYQWPVSGLGSRDICKNTGASSFLVVFPGCCDVSVTCIRTW